MLFAALLAFFLSGFAALIYQVTWQRMLVIFSGADVYSATMVVAAFMAGLGLGSLGGGHLADRLSRFGCLFAFALAEAGIALFGFQSKALLYDVLYGRFAEIAAMPVVAAVMLFLSLLWPTCLMGASLPLLSRALTASVSRAARTIGWLYGLNTLGAALGALAATWWYLPHHGIAGALQVAAWINLACAALVVPLAVFAWFRQTRDAGGKTAVQSGDQVSPGAGLKSRPPVSRGTGLKSRHDGNDTADDRSGGTSVPPAAADLAMPFSTWVLLYGLAGFIALSYELVWFRLLGVMLKSTAFTFGTLLAQYLFWLGVGGALGGIIAPRLKRPAFAFLIIQCAAGVYAGLALTLLVAEVPTAASLKWLHDYFGGYEPIEIAEAVAMLRGALNDALWHTVEMADLPLLFGSLYFVLPAVLIAPATLLMGLSFPVLQRIVQTDVTMVGRRTGLLLLANIAGSTLGAMLTGWLFLGVLGTAGTLRALLVLAGGFALTALRRPPGRRQRLTAAAMLAATLLLAAVAPSGGRLWAVLHGTNDRQMLLAEDASGVSVLRQSALNPAAGVTVFVNGLGQSHLPFGGIHTELGAIPALLHPSPISAAIIGLGSGDTLFGAAGRRELQRIVSIEIIKPQLDTLAMLYQRYPYPGLATVLSDPRVEHVFADGRLVLKTSGELFDIIEADALRPTSAFSGNLYSDEYFRLMQARLKPGGYAVTWSPTERVERTFLRVFPYVLQLGAILVGSNQPIEVDRARVEARIADPVVQRYYGDAGVDIARAILPLLESARYFTPADPRVAAEEDINTDLYPRDEFQIPRVFDWYMLKPEGSR